ncbi:hypothetical protein LCGC14_1853370 [marine sediment metagenome]|uniref:Uncharacterized protein n=1 Tax=marine sediment metagenome TaxID=412755 RepID=A0A0F9GXY9_9ZZZZ
MPYVKQERRPYLDPVVKEMAEANLTGEYLEQLLFVMYHEWRGALVGSPVVESILKNMDKVDVKPNGDINYILFKYAKYHIKPSYNNYKAFIGYIHKATNKTILGYQLRLDNWEDYIDEYREAAAEIRRKILAPYEDKKERENGPIL